jgi:hypothetical protein
VENYDKTLSSKVSKVAYILYFKKFNLTIYEWCTINIIIVFFEGGRMVCEYYGSCGFFKKHQEIHAEQCRLFEKNYCLGKLHERCERKKFRKEHDGQPPSDDMMPNGLMLRDSRMICKNAKV